MRSVLPSKVRGRSERALGRTVFLGSDGLADCISLKPFINADLRAPSMIDRNSSTHAASRPDATQYATLVSHLHHLSVVTRHSSDRSL